VKIVFCSYLRQNWIDHSAHIGEYISPAKVLRYVIIVCNYQRRTHVAGAVHLVCFEQRYCPFSKTHTTVLYYTLGLPRKTHQLWNCIA